MKKFKEAIKEEVRLAQLINAAKVGTYSLTEEDIAAIALNGRCSIAYAMSILKARFPAGEAAIEKVGGNEHTYYLMWCVEMDMIAKHGVDSWGRIVNIEP